MDDELLDLVNEKDEIIGKVWQSEANQNPKLIHREAAVIIYNDNGRILFQKRSHLKKIHPGSWSVTAAGHVDKGENTMDTAHRELKEEVGFDTNLSFFDKTLTHLPNETHFTYWYTGKFPKNAKIILQKDEVDDAKFLSPKELKEIIGDLGVHSKAAVKKIWQKGIANIKTTGYNSPSLSKISIKGG